MTQLKVEDLFAYVIKQHKIDAYHFRLPNNSNGNKLVAHLDKVVATSIEQREALKNTHEVTDLIKVLNACIITHLALAKHQVTLRGPHPRTLGKEQKINGGTGLDKLQEVTKLLHEPPAVRKIAATVRALIDKLPKPERSAGGFALLITGRERFGAALFDSTKVRV